MGENLQMGRLEKMVRALTGNGSKTRGACYDATALASKIEPTIRVIDGKIRLDSPISPDEALEEPHTYGRLLSGEIVEFTGNQYNAGLLHKFGSGIVIVRPGDPNYSKYQDECVRNITDEELADILKRNPQVSPKLLSTRRR